MNGFNGLSVQLTTHLGWDLCVQLNGTLHCGHGALIDLKWAIAKQDALREIRKMFIAPNEATGNE